MKYLFGFFFRNISDEADRGGDFKGGHTVERISLRHFKPTERQNFVAIGPVERKISERPKRVEGDEGVLVGPQPFFGEMGSDVGIQAGGVR